MGVTHRNIETGVDRLLGLVNRQGLISVNEVAAVLAVSKDTIKDWANSLEESGIITMQYGLFNVYLASKFCQDYELNDKIKKLQNKSLIFDRKAEGTRLYLNRAKETLHIIVKEVETLRKELNIESVKKELKEIYTYIKMCDKINEELKKSRKKAKEMDPFVNFISKEYKQEKDKLVSVLENPQIKKEIDALKKLRKPLLRLEKLDGQQNDFLHHVKEVIENRDMLEKEVLGLMVKTSDSKNIPINHIENKIGEIDRKFSELEKKRKLFEEEFNSITVEVNNGSKF